MLLLHKVLLILTKVFRIFWISFVVYYRQPHEGIRAVAVCGYFLTLKYILKSLKDTAEFSLSQKKIKDFQQDLRVLLLSEVYYLNKPNVKNLFGSPL